VRLVAFIAGHPAGVLLGNHLRKSGGLGRVLFVAPAAEIGDIRQFGLDGRGVAGMLRLRSVAGFAGHMGMLAGGADLRLIVMAQDAGGLSGIRDGMRTNCGERPWPVVAELTEGFGNDGAANNQEDPEDGQKDHRGAYQMDPVSKSATHCHPLRVKSMSGEQYHHQTAFYSENER
jgi:hypothetical protein